MLAESHDEEQIIARVAALDIGKAELVCCVRVPAPEGGKRRLQDVSTHSTMTKALTELANRLVEMRVERVVMEATSDYWKPVFYLLEAHGLDPWLVNARDVKHLPGRPKTDVLDAVWLCKVAERQMLRPSFVPPWPIRRLRDLTRYRTDPTTRSPRIHRDTHPGSLTCDRKAGHPWSRSRRRLAQFSDQCRVGCARTISGCVWVGRADRGSL